MEKPNVIVILTDDMGYTDVDVYGATGFSTPNLDRMAREGMRFTDFYVPISNCTPSRAALLTGSYPKRVGMSYVLAPKGPDWLVENGHRIGIHEDELTMAEMLKNHGYRTACVGKWHLGHKPPFLPTAQGFDYYYGLPFSNDMSGGTYGPLPLMRNTSVIEENPNQDLLTKNYTKEATRFIRENKDQPFFLYLAHSMPHVPIHASESFRGRTEKGLYGDVIEEIDWSVGRVLDTIEKLGLRKRTLVFFTSDNGPWLRFGNHGGSAEPLREGKHTTFEGGVRTPFLAWWPGQIPPGTVSKRIVTIMDLLPTVAEATGADRPEKKIDGKSFLNLLRNPDAEGPRDTVLFYWNEELRAVRHKDWKFHYAHSYHDVKSPGKDGSGGKLKISEIEPSLFYLPTDPGEQNNLIEKHPDVAEKIRSLGRQTDERIKQNRRPHGLYEKNQSR